MFSSKAAAAAVAVVAAMSIPGGAQANVGDPCKSATLAELLQTSDTDAQCETAYLAGLEAAAPTSDAVGAVASGDTNRIAPVATDPESATPETDDEAAFDLANESMPAMVNIDPALQIAAWGCRWYTSQWVEQMSYGLVRATGRFHVDGDCHSLVGYKLQIQRKAWNGWKTVHETNYKAMRGGHYDEVLLGCKLGTYDWRSQIVVRKATFSGSDWHWEYDHYQSSVRRYRCNRDYIPLETPFTS
jgi:hypothetical protein